jgi:hypothetical protein
MKWNNDAIFRVVLVVMQLLGKQERLLPLPDGPRSVAEESGARPQAGKDARLINAA